MEEDGAVKAPVTRLRRRLSVEQADDVSSPSAPSTPTKKRATRLAAKPQLDNIDENAPVNSPAKATRRSTARDLIDPEEKLMTPTRRAAARVRSTSITSDVTQGVASPRAIRAMRRSSFTGSDTEAPVTPARQTRRTRKDSNSSVENAEPATKPIKLVVEETISEESESIKSSGPQKSLNECLKSSKQESTAEPEESKKSSPNNSATEYVSPSSVRKSNRIAAKQGDTSLNASGSEMNSSTSQNKNLSNSQTKTVNESTQNVIIELVAKLKDTKKPVLKSERLRTRSWAPASETLDVSDKANKTYGNRSFNKKQRMSNSVCAGDAIVFEATVKGIDKANPLSDGKHHDVLNSSGKKRKNGKNEPFESDNIIDVNLNSSQSKKSGETEQIDGIDTVDYDAQQSQLNRVTVVSVQAMHATEKILQQPDDKSIKDRDDAKKLSQAPSIKALDDDDQCVPVVNHNMNDPAPEAACNTSCEPMDVDVTIPDDLVITNFNTSKKDESINESDTKFNKSEMNESLNKSSVSKAMPDLDKTGNENKSTLILSQIKDDSAVDTNVSKFFNKEPSSPSNASLYDKDKETKNNSLAKETPHKNKKLIKSGIQTSTPVTSSIEAQNMEQNYSKNTSNISMRSSKSEPSESSSSDEESSDDDNSNSKLMIDEAEDAGDDYESGDSQDESERRYIEENEIIEKGETLRSSHYDDSDDSDYEKDSFVVSSDEEDDDLLTGSGEDLSLSANELTMSAKSKNKFNEKKRKEQKNASKEMFAARHQKDSTQDDSEDEVPIKEKKKKRMRLESANNSSADESLIKTKNNKHRLRIDSSQESNLEKSDHGETKSKKKKKKLNKSSDITNEHEITSVVNESIIEKTDPLKAAVKMEPNTPQKLDISTVNISARYEMEEVDVNDMTVTKANETSDPLQAKMTCGDDDDLSSLSENEEIKQNYESMLSQLNTSKNKHIKDHDTMNVNERSEYVNEPIVDQLYLTHSENTKKIRKESVSANDKKSELDKHDSSSVMQLLFPNDGEESDQGKKKNRKCLIVEENDNFIPLKKSEGKTDLRKSLGATKEAESKPTPGSNKINKNMSLESSNTDEIDSTTAAELPEKDDKNMHISQNKKTNNKKLSLSEDPSEHIELTLIATPGSSKKTLNRLSVSEDTDYVAAEMSEIAIVDRNKKKKNSQSVSEDSDVVIAKSSKIATVCSSKKKKNRQSVFEDTVEVSAESSEVVTVGCGKKKKKRQSVSEDTDEVTAESSEVATVGSSKTKNNRQSITEDTDIVKKSEILQVASPGSHKMKKNKISISENTEITAETQLSTAASQKKKKNKQSVDKQLSQSLLVEGIEKLDAGPVSVSLSTGKKKKTSESSNVETAKTLLDTSFNQLIGSAKKKNRKLSQSLPTAAAQDSSGAAADGTSLADTRPNVDQIVGSEITTQVSSKKRKRSLGEVPQVEVIAPLDGGSLAEGSRKKKPKMSPETEEVVSTEESVIEKRDKKNKKDIVDELKDDSEPKSRRGNKKRAREEDEATMVPKQSVFHSVQISRLPTTVLDQLDAKSKEVGKKPQTKAAKIVSTSAFTVEETTKGKNIPSQYLEESVYLSSDSPDKKKRKISTKKPKILPFRVTSSSGFTTNFQVNVLSTETKFVAQLGDLPNFKSSYFQGKNVKKMGTYEMYKRYRNVKMSKF